ncbi:glutathione S-transferase 3, mitochondrial-like [Diadema antillarum]|uniref:glutathione S-transferase 3, mitochondrial-like n=1 Tax=Diadema antillarum TaxID=105358 RepID=UPI003A846705
MATVTLSADFAYVMLTGVASVIMLAFLGERVGVARKIHKVEYPMMYSPDNMLFNCSQRAHQNTLENYPQFLMLLFLAGIGFPRAASVCGLVWIVSRFSYAYGYYTGDPAKRMRGVYGYIGLLGLLGLSITNALRLLEIV